MVLHKTVLNGLPPTFQITTVLQLPAIYHEQPARKPLFSTQTDLHSWTKIIIAVSYKYYIDTLLLIICMNMASLAIVCVLFIS